MAGRKNFKGRQEKRNETADLREEAREARTPKQQFAVLDKRLGVNIGAKRERVRLGREPWPTSVNN